MCFCKASTELNDMLQPFMRHLLGRSYGDILREIERGKNDEEWNFANLNPSNPKSS